MMNENITIDETLKLIDEKNFIERKIQLLHEILDKNGNVGMEMPLIDSEGYPRSDIDVYQVRHARHAIICLQNDHKAVMKKIEQNLGVIHQNGSVSNINPNGIDVSTPSEDLVAFAVIDRIDSNSPAERDGLQVNDQLCKFGSVSADNFQSLSNIGEVVQHSINKVVQVIVRRENKEKVIFLTPRPWAGRGYLGCNVIPLENLER